MSNRQDELMKLADDMADKYRTTCSPRSDAFDDVAYRRSRDALAAAIASLQAENAALHDCCAQNEEAIAAANAETASLQARLDAATWQPIGTAPKDRDVWVYGLARVWTGSTPFMWQGQAGYDDELMGWVTTSHDDSGRVLNVIPTHWMPLPTAPEFA